jgi:nucleoside-diphosphate-sugar epimerase
MEALAREAPRHLVARLPQVVGDTPNPHTLTNALRDAIVEGREVRVWQHAERNLVDVDDVVAIVAAVLDDASRDRVTITVAGPESIAILDLVRVFERVLGRAATTRVEPRGASARIDASEARRYAERAGVSFAPGYIERVVRKYYGPVPG